MSEAPAAPQPSPGPFVAAWSQSWFRAVVLLVVWVAIALFFFAINADHSRPLHQALLVFAWGVIGVAFGALWFVIEGALSSWMDRSGVRRRRLVAWFCYVVFFALMIVVLTAVSSGADPDDWRVMAWIAFMAVAAFPSPGFLRAAGHPTLDPVV